MEKEDVIIELMQTMKNLRVESDIKKKQIEGGTIAIIDVTKTFK